MLCVFVATLAVSAYEWKCACRSTQYILQARVHVAARIKPHTRTDAYSASALLNTVQHNLQCQHSSLMREEIPTVTLHRLPSLPPPLPQTPTKRPTYTTPLQTTRPTPQKNMI